MISLVRSKLRKRQRTKALVDVTTGYIFLNKILKEIGFQAEANHYEKWTLNVFSFGRINTSFNL